MEYVFDGYSSHYCSGSGAEDEDPTPKPLRITKRGDWPSVVEDTSGHPSSITHIHKPLSLRTLPEATKAALRRDSSFVRLRHSSEIASRASLSDSTAATEADPRITLNRPRSPATASRNHAAGALTVRKQRQCGTTSSAGTGSIVLDGMHGDLLSHPPVELTTGNTQQWNRDQSPQRLQIGRERPAERARRICNRAVTERAHLKPQLSHACSERSGTFAASASTPFLFADNGRATSEKVPHSDRVLSIASQHSEHQQLEEDSTRHSSLNRLLSRVMNSLGHKGATSQTASERGRSRKDSDSSLRSKRDAPSGTYQGRESSSTTSSDETNTTMETEIDLDAALAAFPAPPKSTIKSPSATLAAQSTPGTPTLTPSTPFTPQNLCGPEEVTIMGAKLTIVPEIGDVNDVGEQSIFTAIGVEGAMNAPVHPSFGFSDRRKLDVAVVVDNSYGTIFYRSRECRILTLE